MKIKMKINKKEQNTFIDKDVYRVVFDVMEVLR